MNQSKAQDVKARLRPFGIVFEKSLTDLIKGIRAHKDPEEQAKFLQDAVNECRKEVKSADMDTKTMAILKLSYLEMYGFDMSWANFHVLEVMSSSKFQQKRVGYLAAIQALRNDNDVLMLTTNLLKKDLNSSKSVEVGVALSGISTVVTTPLASDITDDIIKMLNHSKPYIRKKAVLAMYKIFLKYPEALRTHLQRIFDKLDDSDESVVTATVTVICELSKKTPKLLVGLAPQLYEMLNSSKNNWMLIRLLKLFANLAVVEPRLKTKLLDPILELMSNTKATSLVYECVNCLVTGNMITEDDYQIADVCLGELVQFFKQIDSNLEYVGLLAFYKIGKINSKFIRAYDEQILKFIEHDDVTIREKALELIHGIVDDDNLFHIVKTLMIQLVPEDEKTDDHDEEDQGPLNVLKKSSTIILSDSYKAGIIKKILEISSSNNYENIPSFEWYIAVISDLIDLSLVNNLQTGDVLGEQLRDIAVRVPSIRKEVISISIKILNNEKIFTKLPEVLTQVIWLTGEYSDFVKNGDVLIRSILTNEQKLLQLEPKVLKLFIPAIIKIYSNFSNKDQTFWDFTKKESVLKLTIDILEFLTKLTISKHFEIQERSVEFSEFLKLTIESIEEHPDSAIEPPLLLSNALPSLFNSWELNPISQGSQKRLALPQDLDLDTPINGDLYDEYYNSDDNDEDYNEEFEEDLYEDHGNLDEDYDHGVENGIGSGTSLVDLQSSGDVEFRKKERLERLKDDPYYLSNDSNSQILSPRLKNENIGTPRSITPSVELEDPIVQKKQLKKPKKKKVMILSDEVIIDNRPEELNSDQESQRSGSVYKPLPGSKKKTLLTIDSSNLDNFDIGSRAAESPSFDASYEVAKLREQLEKTEISGLNQTAEEGEEEVIVIRKKKDKKKKIKYDENGNVIEKKKKKKKTEEETS